MSAHEVAETVRMEIEDEWPGEPADGWPENPYDEDGYCIFCGNGSWKYHAPWCGWQDAQDAREAAR